MASGVAAYCIFGTISGHSADESWQLGPFERVDDANPILSPSSDEVFNCPLQEKEVHWEAEHIFNPGAIVRDGKVYLFYRAEDDYGDELGKHTSRIGLAESLDGIHFVRRKSPVLFPDFDKETTSEFPGGCEDARVVETEEGTYVMTYTQWNHKTAALGIAVSDDLVHWEKKGYAFEENVRKIWSKSGSIVCRLEGDRMIATKIQGKYWMYWGEGSIYAATSDDLISWNPLLTEERMLLPLAEPRKGYFDSMLVEAGPPALITKDGIRLLYNGKNGILKRSMKLKPKAYAAGQILFDAADPTKVLARCEDYFLAPERSYEMKGQYLEGTVFVQGLVHFQDRWFLYYGAADSNIGVATCADE